MINTQVVKRDSNGHPFVADDIDVEVFFEAVADTTGSINSFSKGKTDFWQYANALFAVNLQDGEGLTGLYMPGDDPQSRGPQAMEFNLQKGLFSSEGIAITATDDTFFNNTYPYN